MDQLKKIAGLLMIPYWAAIEGVGVIYPIMGAMTCLGIYLSRRFSWPSAITVIIIVQGVHFQLIGVVVTLSEYSWSIKKLFEQKDHFAMWIGSLISLAFVIYFWMRVGRAT